MKFDWIEASFKLKAGEASGQNLTVGISGFCMDFHQKRGQNVDSTHHRHDTTIKI